MLRTASLFLIAWLIHRLGVRIAARFIRLNQIAPKRDRPSLERQQTLQTLIASFISVLVFSLATLFSLMQFVGVDTLLWIVGLFSAAFGLGARPQLSDILSGMGFLFEDTFSVGEKVEILDMEGVIEAVNLRTTWMRSPTGELYVIPNGEIRVVRNFSRGRFSIARLRLKIEASQLAEVLSLLETLSRDAVNFLPDLLEPWKVINESGMIGQHAELTLLAHTRFGRAADTQPRLLALVQEHLDEAGITLVD
ncbi:MAG: mechanosensitive ion channel family protein [Anaerolineales bacterium]|jgi:small-conductance mechanosensitive channel|nr:mechanosensitive ion channel family protein [Anaerolineales bacterium]